MFGRKINVFEKLLLPVGAALTFFGFYLIILAEKSNTTLSWLRLAVVFIWMMLLFIIIVAATTEDMKEELSLIQREHISEIKVLKEIAHELLQEIKLMRQENKVRK
jgi:hypothetical protein